VGERWRQAEGGRRRLGRAQPMGDLGAQDQGGGSTAEEHAGGTGTTHLGMMDAPFIGWFTWVYLLKMVIFYDGWTPISRLE